MVRCAFRSPTSVGPASVSAPAWSSSVFFHASAARGRGYGRHRAICTPAYLQQTIVPPRVRGGQQQHENQKRRNLHQSRCRTFSACASLRAGFHDKRNLYQVLGVSTAATKEEIKKKFYALSLAHHPDKNRSKPKSSSVYSSISAAYNTLSDDAARAKYDADHNINPSRSPSSRGGAGGHPKSHVGSRPASGLSKRRSPFHGPPPSFYSHGRYGKTGRSAPMPNPAADKEKGKAQPTEPDAAWFVDDNQVPHFDAKSHLQTQKNQDERRRQRRIASLEGDMKRRPDVADSDVGGTEATRFFMLTAVIGFAAVATLVYGGRAARKEQKQTSGRYENRSEEEVLEERRQKQVAEGGQN